MESETPEQIFAEEEILEEATEEATATETAETVETAPEQTKAVEAKVVESTAETVKEVEETNAPETASVVEETEPAPEKEGVADSGKSVEDVGTTQEAAPGEPETSEETPSDVEQVFKSTAAVETGNKTESAESDKASEPVNEASLEESDQSKVAPDTEAIVPPADTETDDTPTTDPATKPDEAAAKDTEAGEALKTEETLGKSGSEGEKPVSDVEMTELTASSEEGSVGVAQEEGESAQPQVEMMEVEFDESVDQSQVSSYFVVRFYVGFSAGWVRLVNYC